MAGAEACASEHPNVTIDIQFPSSADDSAEQLDLFRSALDDDSVDAVVISPMQSGQLSAAAESTDKPIIALDTDFTSDKKLSFVGTGNEAAAKSGGLAAMKKAKSNGADKPQAVILTGAQGDETHEALSLIHISIFSSMALVRTKSGMQAPVPISLLLMISTLLKLSLIHISCRRTVP